MTSAQYLFNFTNDRLSLDHQAVSILSVFKDKLLIGCFKCHQLFVHSSEGGHLLTITTHENEELGDADWTPRGNIVYTTLRSSNIVVTSHNGTVLHITAHNQLTSPRIFNVFNDTIYLADWEKGVYQSTDEGVSFDLVFELTNGWFCGQVV